MKTIADINPADYIQTFESRGTTLLFQHFGLIVYMPNKDWVTIDRLGHELTYGSKQSLIDFAQEGETRTQKDAEEAQVKLASYINEAFTLAHKFSALTPEALTREDVEEANLCMANVCIWYRFFDPFYWETVFEKARKLNSDETVEGPAATVQGYKNVAREGINKIFMNEDGLFLLMVKLIAKKFSLTQEELDHYLMPEVLTLFNDLHFRVDTSEIEKRKKLFVVYCLEGNEPVFISGEKAEQFAIRFEAYHSKKAVVSTGEVKGKTAFSNGKIIRGKVKIITREYGSEVDTFRKKMAEMLEGEILVSETTEPDMMQALKKAAAIVTDIGGLLSHAAITARELKTPCVVNSRLATKVFKDGDMVEVDAEKGIVRKI
jgi:phosphohistidine swiveling domain-containing protein